MIHIKFRAASRIYKCSADLNLNCYEVYHADFALFSIELKHFIKFLGISAVDDYWKPFIRSLKRLRFYWSAAPIPFNYNEIKTGADLDILSTYIKQCDLVFSGSYNPALGLLNTAIKLSKSSDNPLLECIKGIFGCSDSTILINANRLIPTVENVLHREGLADINLVNPSQLREDIYLKKLIVIGSTTWFPEYIFTAPRASAVYIVKYGWISDNWERDSVFIGNSTINSPNNPHRKIKLFLDESSRSKFNKFNPDSQLNSDEIVPRIDWEQVKRRAKSVDEVHYTEEEGEKISAVVLVLEGDMGVLVDPSEGSKSTIIDPDGKGSELVKRVAISELLPEMFILLRTAGGGEFISDLADTILGEEASPARKAQKLWKRLLRNSIEQDSIHSIVAKLKKLGSPKASEANLRNWTSYRTIKTEDPRDFIAILRLINLDHQKDDLWSTMTMIDSAHRRAGHQIRELLLKQIRASDLSELKKQGKMEFQVPGSSAGSITAFRIKYLDEDLIEVPIYRLNRPFNLEIE